MSQQYRIEFDDDTGELRDPKRVKADVSERDLIIGAMTQGDLELWAQERERVAQWTDTEPTEA